MTDQQRKDGYDAVRRSLMRKLQCWNESCVAEELLGHVVDTDADAFSNLCANLRDPEEALTLDDETIKSLLGETDG